MTICIRPEETLPTWADGISMPPCAPLAENIETDVCVVGAGIAGLSTAYLLSKQGKRVCVLEDYEIGSGQTGRSTAHMTYVLDTRFFDLEEMHGEETVRLAIESHIAAMNEVNRICHIENIDCDLSQVDAYLFLDPESSLDLLDQELKTLQKFGVNDVEWIERIPFLGFDSGSALCFPKQLQMHPLKYLKALSEALLREGGKIHTRTHVSHIKGGDRSIVRTKSGFNVHAKSIVVATNSPINDRFAIHTKQYPYRSYAIAARIPKGQLRPALFWDTANPYHYIRVQPGTAKDTHDLLITGGEDHKTGQHSHPEMSFERLEKWTRQRFAFAEDVVYRWSGQVLEPVDGLAYIGRNPMDYDNVFVITGHSGNGITYGTLGAIIVRDLILGFDNPWTTVYSPSRITLKSVGEYVRENINVVAQYADHFGGENLQHVAELKDGEGVVVQDGMKKVAAYRDSLGHIHLNSAVCPHLGGIVHWNTTEKSWDCPCHGSRFDGRGRVIEGPASKNLERAEIDSASIQIERHRDRDERRFSHAKNEEY
jgi:glycine/D-amino acid oxidase-like deaminating enzyme/nitrite reductase/ring-hydroxylating ferredoxin subunit